MPRRRTLYGPSHISLGRSSRVVVLIQLRVRTPGRLQDLLFGGTRENNRQGKVNATASNSHGLLWDKLKGDRHIA